jgi:hypothetical protein
VVDDGVFSRLGVTVTVSADVVQENVVNVILEIDAVADEIIATGGRDVSLKSTVHGDTPGNGAVRLARRSRNVRCAVSNGQPADEWVATSQLCIKSIIIERKPKQKGITHSGEGDDESSKVMFDVERFHHTSLDLLNGSRAIAGNVPMVGEGVQSRYETVSDIANRRRTTYGKVHGGRSFRVP